jgi:excisionase family DNA binding protein
MTAETATSWPSGIRLLRPADVAKALSLSVPRIYQLAAEGKIASIKMDKSLRFDPEDVMAYIRSHRRERRTA